VFVSVLVGRERIGPSQKCSKPVTVLYLLHTNSVSLIDVWCCVLQ